MPPFNAIAAKHTPAGGGQKQALGEGLSARAIDAQPGDPN